MGHNNVIELNGKRYDALTGAYLGKSKAAVVPAAPPVKGRNLDGFIRPALHSETPSTPKSGRHAKTHPAAQAPRLQKPARRHKPHHAQPHQPQHAKTLMRHAVHKPQATLKPAIKPQAPVEMVAAPASALMPKKSALQVDTVRMQRARQAARHQHVQRFSRTTLPPQRITPVAHHPAPMPANQPAPAARAHSAPRGGHTDIFEAALARANSHREPTPKVARTHHRRRRMVRIATAAIIFVIMAGMIAWFNRSDIELRVASFQAGFSAHMPEYQPTDYTLSSIDQAHGEVNLTYRSGDRHYRITQQTSNWNSQTLLDSAVAGASTEDKQVIQSKGRTIYLYEGNNATWVDGGIRYNITGNAYLTPEDITAIVDSL